MKIRLKENYFGLRAFPEQEIPDFTLVTGLNGAGKSHLLRATEGGNAEITDLVLQGERAHLVVRFDSSGFALNSQTNYDGFHNLETRDDAAAFVEREYAPIRSAWREWGSSRGYDDAQLLALTRLAQAQNIDITFDAGHQSDLRDLLQQWTDSTKEPSWRPLAYRDIITTAAKRRALPFFLLSEADVQWAVLDPVPFFRSSVGAVFSLYRDRLYRNSVARALFIDGHSKIDGMGPDEFKAVYGPPPWDVLNDILRSLGLEAQFTGPPLNSSGTYGPTLVLPDGATISFDDLSSGERVIALLALCGYERSERSERVTTPVLLLLDEVDGPLHPSMIGTYLSVIVDILVGKFGMKVIASTHSPSTVALFPGELIGLMTKGKPGIELVSKDVALAALTDGVPTLSVRADGRRQVFVESPADVENYEALYRLLRDTLNSPRSLQFIPTGTREKNSSCEIVIRIVEALANNGSATTRGLIDWDGKNKSRAELVVLAENRRDGKENVLFDPLVVALAIYRDFPERAGTLGLPRDVVYRDFFQPVPQTLQRIVTAVAQVVLGKPAIMTTKVAYVGGLELEVDSDYLTTDDHALEAKLVGAMPFLNQVAKQQAGLLAQYFITRVLSDHPWAIPYEIKEAFEALLG